MTVPNGSPPPGEAPDATYLGNGRLWTSLWPHGLVLVPPDDIATITNRLRWHVDKFNGGSGLAYPLAMSIGVSRYESGNRLTLEGLVNAADAAMYRHKRPGATGPA